MKVKIGEVVVDAGLLMVGDPCYFVGKDATINERCSDWQTACNQVFCAGGGRDDPMDVFGLGVAVETTYGDGVYPVFLKTSKTGRRQLIVNLD